MTITDFDEATAYFEKLIEFVADDFRNRHLAIDRLGCNPPVPYDAAWIEPSNISLLFELYPPDENPKGYQIKRGDSFSVDISEKEVTVSGDSLANKLSIVVFDNNKPLDTVIINNLG